MTELRFSERRFGSSIFFSGFIFIPSFVYVTGFCFFIDYVLNAERDLDGATVAIALFQYTLSKGSEEASRRCSADFYNDSLSFATPRGIAQQGEVSIQLLQFHTVMAADATTTSPGRRPPTRLTSQEEAKLVGKDRIHRLSEPLFNATLRMCFLPNGIEAPPTDHKVLTSEEAKANVKETIAIVDRWMDSDAWVPWSPPTSEHEQRLRARPGSMRPEIEAQRGLSPGTIHHCA